MSCPDETISVMVDIARTRPWAVPVALIEAGYTSAEVIEYLPDVMKRLGAAPQGDALIERLERLENGATEAIRIYDTPDAGNWYDATQVLRAAVAPT